MQHKIYENRNGSSLASSKSTVYVGNLPFSLTNSDLHKLFQKYGKIVKVTIIKDKVYRKSKGVAFLHFFKREDAVECVQKTHKSVMYDRTLVANIAKDNGRAAEFNKRREYPDKSRCYECGQEGHLSYSCSRNVLGKRQPPVKKARKRKIKDSKQRKKEEELDEEDEVEDIEEESLSAAIQYQHELRAAENFLADGKVCSTFTGEDRPKSKRIRTSAYFSDEEVDSD